MMSVYLLPRPLFDGHGWILRVIKVEDDRVILLPMRSQRPEHPLHLLHLCLVSPPGSVRGCRLVFWGNVMSNNVRTKGNLDRRRLSTSEPRLFAHVQLNGKWIGTLMFPGSSWRAYHVVRYAPPVTYFIDTFVRISRLCHTGTCVAMHAAGLTCSSPTERVVIDPSQIKAE